MGSNEAQPFVVIDGITKRFPVRGSWRRKDIVAVDSVSLEIGRGEIVSLVGESGSGKSTLGRICVGLEKPSEGRILFGTQDVARLRGRRSRAFRQHAQIVFQNPYLSLNPRMRVGDALKEVLSVWHLVPKDRRTSRSVELMEAVHLPAAYLSKYPHELSGGECQRVAIARALAMNPDFLVADEVVSALDVSVSAHVVNLLLELSEQLNIACLFITHDLNLARVIGDRVAVMRQGSVVEYSTSKQIFTAPQHPYTRELIDAQLTIPRR